MAETIKFHLDENIRNAIAEGLRRRAIDVTTTSEQSLNGVSDEVQLKFALSQNRVIFTQDTDFLRMNQTGMTHYYVQRGLGDVDWRVSEIPVFDSWVVMKQVFDDICWALSFNPTWKVGDLMIFNNKL